MAMDLLDALLASAHLGSELASHKFFEPNSKFFRAMEAFRKTCIYDVGAGMGHVSASLFQAGHSVVAIDTGFRENQDSLVQLANGVSYLYEAGSTVLLCRPCHGPFVESVIRRAEECHVGAVIYVGFAKNVDGDCGYFARRFVQTVTAVGRERERLYVYKVAHA